jgi:hypothetical protein
LPTPGPDRLAILVLAYCGLRFGELAALRVRNVDPLRRRLQIEGSVTEVDGVMVFGTPKSHHCRSVPVPRSLVDALTAACIGKSPDDLVFTAPRGGVIILRNWRRRVFDPALAKAGLDDITPHELRHTAASLAVAAGANVKAVQRMLGHASAAMTLDVYSGLFDGDLDAAPTVWTSQRRARVEIMRTLCGPELTLAKKPRGPDPHVCWSRPRRRVELRGLEPLTPTLPVWCATSCATAPWPTRCLHRADGNDTGRGTPGGGGVGHTHTAPTPPAAAQPSLSWAIRTWLPKGSRKPKSMP